MSSTNISKSLNDVINSTFQVLDDNEQWTIQPPQTLRVPKQDNRTCQKQIEGGHHQHHNQCEPCSSSHTQLVEEPVKGHNQQSLFDKLTLQQTSIVMLKHQNFTIIIDLMLLKDNDLEKLKLSMRDEIKHRSSISDVTKSRGNVTKSTSEQSVSSH